MWPGALLQCEAWSSSELLATTANSGFSAQFRRSAHRFMTPSRTLPQRCRQQFTRTPAERQERRPRSARRPATRISPEREHADGSTRPLMPMSGRVQLALLVERRRVRQADNGAFRRDKPTDRLAPRLLSYVVKKLVAPRSKFLGARSHCVGVR